ncbi:MAG: TlpA family protein disulfide reductase [Limnochordia bacterium]|jgi:thiol-disulfide isomerase/thioredoxin|nr:TlpA family protein disulfide reductase [Bacillota bacterium]
MWNKLLALTTCVLLMAGAAWAQPKDLPVGPEVGQRAPDFQLSDLDGNIHRLSDLRGQRVLLNFWATWCPPCRAEMPAIQEFVDAHGEKVVVIGINAQESRDAIAKFIEEGGYSWLQLRDEKGAVFADYLVRFIPTSFYIDELGVVRNKYIGPMDLPALLKFTGIDS